MQPATGSSAASPSVAGRLVRPGAERLEGSRTSLVRLVRSEPLEKFYPPRAREQGIDGFVTVDLLINELGLVLEAQVLTESPPDQGFALAGLDAAKTYEFENSLHRLVLMTMTIRFLP